MSISMTEVLAAARAAAHLGVTEQQLQGLLRAFGHAPEGAISRKAVQEYRARLAWIEQQDEAERNAEADPEEQADAERRAEDHPPVRGEDF